MKKFTLIAAVLFSQLAVFAQAQRLVLYEEFSGENCGPCAAINPDLLDYIEQNAGSVLILKYQVPIPSAGPIYNQFKTDANTRRTYYSVSSAPQGRQDGANVGSSAHPYYYITDPSLLTNRAAVPSPFNIVMNYTMSADADSFYLKVDVVAAQAFTGNTLKLRVAMVEDLAFDKAPGTNGEKEFHHVSRKMYPNAAGTSMPAGWINGGAQTWNFSGPYPAYIYDKTKVKFIAFIQDDNGKEVHQSAIADAQLIPNDAQAASAGGKFYQCATNFTPSVGIKNSGSTNLTSAEVEILVDDVQATLPYYWTGNIAPGSIVTVNLPTITVSEGAHILKLIVRNPNGGIDYNTGKDTSKFSFNVGYAPGATPLVEGFEGGSLPYGWAIENSDGGASWTSSASGAGGSTKSYRMYFYASPVGEIDNLYVQRVDLSASGNALITFDRAHAQFPYQSGNSADELQIEVSKNCGTTWIPVYSKAGNALATTAASEDSYVPTSAHWVADSADISIAANNSDVLVRFKGVSEYGNNLFIDNINIVKWGTPTTGIGNLGDSEFVVYPNPATDKVNVQVSAVRAAQLQYSVTNLVGQQLTSGNQPVVTGTNLFGIDTYQLAAGTYLLKLSDGVNTTVKQFTVAR